MASVNMYLNLDGNCGQAFDFYRAAFGGEFRDKTKFSEMPGAGPMPAGEGDKLMHVGLPIGKHSVLMGSDWPSHLGPMIRGNAASVSVQPESKAEADRLFNALSAGGQVAMPMSDAPWGAYFGMFTDRFGIQWMVNFDQRTA